MEANVAMAKVGKYATSESGDTVEMVERPLGGLSFVLVDGQRSGRPAKAISNVVARKAMALLAEGVRDGAAARAASDYLHNYRSGKVSAALNILSIDMESRTLVVTRNSPAPVYLIEDGNVKTLDEPSQAVGTRRGIRPNIHEVPLAPGLAAVVFTDGLLHAGDRTGRHLDLHAELMELSASSPSAAQIWADTLLQRAVDLDEGKPTDDISVLVAAILPRGTDTIRHMHVRVPL